MIAKAKIATVICFFVWTLAAKDEVQNEKKLYFVILVAKDEIQNGKKQYFVILVAKDEFQNCLLYTSPSPRD